jgi:hypothetical protein
VKQNSRIVVVKEEIGLNKFEAAVTKRQSLTTTSEDYNKVWLKNLDFLYLL